MAYFKCNGYGRVINVDNKPDNYDTYKKTDPLTESQLLNWVKYGGLYYAIKNKETSSWIGKYVNIYNSKYSFDHQANFNNISESTCKFCIADINHDGSSNTVDLISCTAICNRPFNNNSLNTVYSSSDIRSYLNGTFYNGFSSALRSKMTYMTAVTTTGNTSDLVKLPSIKEISNFVNNSSHFTIPNEGSAYSSSARVSCSISNYDDIYYNSRKYYITRSRATASDQLIFANYTCLSLDYISHVGPYDNGNYGYCYGAGCVIRLVY